MHRNLIIAFLLASPLGAVLGVAATALLSPRAASGVFDLFLALIILGALGLVVALRPSRTSSSRKIADRSAIVTA